MLWVGYLINESSFLFDAIMPKHSVSWLIHEIMPAGTSPAILFELIMWDVSDVRMDGGWTAERDESTCTLNGLADW